MSFAEKDSNINWMTEQASDVPVEQRAQFTVLGSGIVGLLTAGELAGHGHDVTVVSREGKPSLNTDSTSSMAVGQFLPWVPEEHADKLLGDMSLKEVTDFSRGFYERLAESPHETGVMNVQNTEFVSSDSPWPAGLADAMHAETRELEKPIIFTDPDGNEAPFDQEIKFDTFSINSRKAVAYLANHAESLGVKFEKRELSPDDLTGLEGVVINATGMGARALDESQKVNHYKGHTFVVRPKDPSQLPAEAVSIEDLIIMPREDGTFVCGALYIENPERPVPEEAEAEQLLTRLKKLFAEVSDRVKDISPALLEEGEILVHSAGYRVEVEGGGIRVAPDEKNERLLHAYGFGGLGWSVGPHYAKKISGQALMMHERNNNGV